MRALEREKKKLETFRSQDQPAFNRWLTALFGHRKSELHQLSEDLAEKSRWIDAIESLILFESCTPYEAYLRVKELFESGAQPKEGGGAADEEDPAFDDPFDPFEEEEPRAPLEQRIKEFQRESSRRSFNLMLRQLFGVDPNSLPEDEYEHAYAAFRKQLQHRYELTDEQAGLVEPNPDAKPSTAKTVGQRCKELYRSLVRRLHPDTQADSDPTVGQIWHEVQEAYAREDTERLQMLAALADVHDSVDGTATLWELRQVQTELHDSAKSVRREIRRARKQPEWNFSGKAETTRNEIARTFEEGLETELEQKRADLRALSDQLERWSKPPRQPRKTAPRRKRSSETNLGQEELPF